MEYLTEFEDGGYYISNLGYNYPVLGRIFFHKNKWLFYPNCWVKKYNYYLQRQEKNIAYIAETIKLRKI